MDKEDWCQYLLQSQCVEKVVSEACPKYCKNCVDSETDQTTSGEIKLNIFARFEVIIFTRRPFKIVSEPIS